MPNEKNEIVPGLTFEGEQKPDDLREILSEIANEQSKNEIRERLSFAAILAKVRTLLAKGEPVRITDEMRELNIDGQVLDMAISAGYNKRLLDKLDRDTSDYDDVFGVLD